MKARKLKNGDLTIKVSRKEMSLLKDLALAMSTEPLNSYKDNVSVKQMFVTRECFANFFNLVLVDANL